MKKPTVDELFNKLGGVSAIADGIVHASRSTVSEWRRQASIPVKYWPALIKSAPGRAIELDADTLMRACLAGKP